MSEADSISNIVLGILKRQLHFPKEALLRVAGLKAGSTALYRFCGTLLCHTLETPRFFIHMERLGVAIIVTWVSRIQIPREDTERIGQDEETEDNLALDITIIGACYYHPRQCNADSDEQ
jgi:hypothetical protein